MEKKKEQKKERVGWFVISENYAYIVSQNH